MAIRGGRFAAMACAVLFVVPVAEGQNLVFNPDFDAVGFEEVLYYDGFESGDTGAWSDAVGLPPITD